jgi:hypothetical protein
MLAVSLGANAAIFNLLHTVTLKRLGVPRAEELYLDSKIENGKPDAAIYSYPAFRDMQSSMPASVQLAAFTSIMRAQGDFGSGEREAIGVQLVSSNFFSTLLVEVPNRTCSHGQRRRDECKPFSAVACPTI